MSPIQNLHNCGARVSHQRVGRIPSSRQKVASICEFLKPPKFGGCSAHEEPTTGVIYRLIKIEFDIPYGARFAGLVVCKCEWLGRFLLFPFVICARRWHFAYWRSWIAECGRLRLTAKRKGRTCRLVTKWLLERIFDPSYFYLAKPR